MLFRFGEDRLEENGEPGVNSGSPKSQVQHHPAGPL
jgi:hypothetical protein